MEKWLIIALASSLAAAVPAAGAEVNVLSGGAIEPGLLAAVEAFKKESGHQVNVKFATAPQIRERMNAGTEKPDVLFAPPALIDELMKSGKLDGQGRRVTVGRVGVGVAVRDGAPKPDVASTDAFKRSLLDAEAVIYNTASSGIYVEKMLERIGIGEQLKAKTKRYPTGAAVMEHVLKGSPKEIGIGPITEIRLYSGKGVTFVAPLPADIQNYTSYDAAPGPAPGNRDATAALLTFLAAPSTKAIFASKGVE
jgi:molybdate transport system substrate-binding protein